MRTDRELLELAAKAAGYKYSDFDFAGESGLQLLLPNQQKNWNPLTDDGDAFRLSAKLRVRFEYEGDWRFYPPKDCYWIVTTAIRNFRSLFIREDFADNRSNEMDALRRAIVRAAAEIGATK